ncbi:hypothetical protein TWF569_005997 [Orbilia oligospora]|nr:hypothetical protein TWF569_005997 [Orbilia oligospora]
MLNKMAQACIQNRQEFDGLTIIHSFPSDPDTTSESRIVTKTMDPTFKQWPITTPTTITPHIPYLPNEIIIMILESLKEDAETGNILDEPAAQEFILSLREVSRVWNTLVLDIFLRHVHITTGFFPENFNPLYPVTAMRTLLYDHQGEGYYDDDEYDEYDEYEDKPEDIAFEHIENELQILHLSDYFLNLHPESLYGIRTITIDISCTTGDIDPVNAITRHRDFALAMMNCISLEKITIRAHGMSRLDSPDSGLDALFAAWNLAATEEQGEKFREGDENADGNTDQRVLYGENDGCAGSELTRDRMVQRPPGAIFQRLKGLIIEGYTDATAFSDSGLSDLLSFILRHRTTLETIKLENIGVKDHAIRANSSVDAEVDGDAKEAFKFWNQFRKTVLRNCPKVKVLDLRMVSYTIMREGPLKFTTTHAQNVQVLDHSSIHTDDWPYEIEVRMSYVQRFNSLTGYQVHHACGCRCSTFVDPKDGEGIDLIADRHRFAHVEMDLRDE